MYSYLKNNNLNFIKNNSKGNTLKDGIFINLYGQSGISSVFDILKWKLRKNKYKTIKKNDKYKMKIIKNTMKKKKKEDYISWLGHASFLIQINGKKILTDPCLFAPPFIKRLTRLPCNIEDIKPDYLLISHGHYDHLDKKSIKYFNKSTALIPLKMGKLVKKFNKTINIQEAAWYQKYNINEEFEIFFLPAHHWHKRTLKDQDKTLWGSFLIKTKTKTIYFAGDSGYSKHFKDIGNMFDIDIALLPIGAYEPRWFMKSSHINPQEALKAYKDLNAKEFIPMHFGTFDLSDEPISEPPKLLKKIKKDENIKFLDIGEEFILD